MILDRSVCTALAVSMAAMAVPAHADVMEIGAEGAQWIAGPQAAAAVSPDRKTLAVMTYRYLLLYPRPANGNWADAVAGTPRTSELPWLPQAEALGWSPDGRSLYATGEFIPAPLYRIDP